MRIDVKRHSGKRLPRHLKVIDIGAGTGKLGAMFLELGCEVTFVEANPNEIAFLKKHFGDNPKVHIVHADARAMKAVQDKSADLVVMGDAAHWLEPNVLPEFSRVLKPDGQVMLLARFWSQESALTKKVHELLMHECPEYQDSPTQLRRNMNNLRLRLGRHLVDEEKNGWHGQTLLTEYDKERLLNYFKSCSFSSDSIEKNEPSFVKNVIEPLWKFAADKNLLSKGKLRVPYEVNALYGGPRKQIAISRKNAEQHVQGFS